MLSGTLTPPCVEVKEEGGLSGCTLGTTRAFFMSVYLLIGRYSVWRYCMSACPACFVVLCYDMTRTSFQQHSSIPSSLSCHAMTLSSFLPSVMFAGSPLFIFTMGQFYESLVHNAQLSHQRQKYSTDFTPEGIIIVVATVCYAIIYHSSHCIEVCLCNHSCVLCSV